MLDRKQFLKLTGGVIASAGTAIALSHALYNKNLNKKERDALIRDNTMETATDVRGYLASALGLTAAPLAAAGLDDWIVRDTHLMCRLRHTLYDDTIIGTDDTLRTIWEDSNRGAEAHYVQFESIVPVFEAKDQDYVYIVADPTALNNCDLCGTAFDMAIVYDNDFAEEVPDATFDINTGIVSIPKAIAAVAVEHNDRVPFLVQVARRHNLQSDISCEIPIAITSESDDFIPSPATSIICDGCAMEVRVPLSEDTNSIQGLINGTFEANVFLSGSDIALGAFKNLCVIDENGMLRILLQSIMCPGIDVRVRKINQDLASPFAARIAHADEYNEMGIWPFGFVEWDDRIQQLCNNRTVFKYRAIRQTDPSVSALYLMTAADMDSLPRSPTDDAVDEFSWAHLTEWWEDIAPYNYNIHYMTGDDNFPQYNLDFYTTPSSELTNQNRGGLSRYALAQQNNPWTEAVQDTNVDSIAVWMHALLLPSSLTIDPNSFENDLGLGKNFWRAIKNPSRDPNASIEEMRNIDNWTNSVFTAAICIHAFSSAEPTSNGGSWYTGPVYGRILWVDKEGQYNNQPSMVVSFHTAGFGDNGRGQAAQAILRFAIMSDSFLTLKKQSAF